MSTGAAAWTDTFTVTVDGREFRVGKRPGQTNFSVRVEHGGKQIVKSLRTAHQPTAKKNAEHFLKSLLREDWAALEALKKRDVNAKLTAVLEIYEEEGASALHVDEDTVRQNANALRCVVCDALDLEEIGDTRVSALTDELVRKYVRAARKRKLKESSIGSNLTKARSVLQPQALELYRELKLPDLTKFRSVAVTLEKADESFLPFPTGVVTRMERAARLLYSQALRGGKWSRNVWLTYSLMARAGLRNIEVENAMDTWFTERRGPYGLQRCIAIVNREDQPMNTSDGHWEVKNGVPHWPGIDDDLWAEIEPLLPKKKDKVKSQYLIAADSPTERWNVVNRDVNEFVRQYLPGRVKAAYELRKWAGSIICTREFERAGAAQGAIFAAQQFLGHTSVTTTEKHYAKFLSMIAGISMADAMRYAA